jgi:hypothetical protein
MRKTVLLTVAAVLIFGTGWILVGRAEQEKVVEPFSAHDKRKTSDGLYPYTFGTEVVPSTDLGTLLRKVALA